MPWKKDSTKMELRLEFVTLAMREDANISALCRRFGVSRTTGYKWIRRYKAEGKDGLKDQSRKPRSSPNKTSDRVEEAVCSVRRKHPGWGGRFLCLQNGSSGRCKSALMVVSSSLERLKLYAIQMATLTTF